jgi:DNA-binding transcriptional LysR family regulator
MISTTDQWLDIQLRHLAALQAIAEEGSFRRAAVRLGYTQSAISQQIAVLERIVGEQLIDRPGGPRPISLTAAGRLLLRHAEAVLARAQAAQADLAALAAGEGGCLRVGTYQSVGRRIIPALLKEFRATWPQVEIRLRESSNDDDLLDGVESGELDLSFNVFPIADGPFECIELLRDPYVLVVPRTASLAASRRKLRLSDIGALDLIAFRQCKSVRAMEEQLRMRGIEPRIVFRSDDNGTVQALVAAGMGVALVPRLASDESDDQIAVLELDDEEMAPRRLTLVWHRDRYQSPAALAFIETAQRVCEEIAQAGSWRNVRMKTRILP